MTELNFKRRSQGGSLLGICLNNLAKKSNNGNGLTANQHGVGGNWNGLNSPTKVVEDNQIENKVTSLTLGIYKHLTKLGPLNEEETKQQISNFLHNKGISEISISTRPWAKDNEIEYFIKFSFEGNIMDHTKVIRPLKF